MWTINSKYQKDNYNNNINLSLLKPINAKYIPIQIENIDKVKIVLISMKNPIKKIYRNSKFSSKPYYQ